MMQAIDFFQWTNTWNWNKACARARSSADFVPVISLSIISIFIFVEWQRDMQQNNSLNLTLFRSSCASNSYLTYSSDLGLILLKSNVPLDAMMFELNYMVTADSLKYRPNNLCSFRVSVPVLSVSSKSICPSLSSTLLWITVNCVRWPSRKPPLE